MRAGPSLAVVAIGAALAGCGTAGGGEPSAGQALFAQDCSSCHSLSGRQAPRRQGGDLVGLHVGREAMLQFVREMPVSHRLSPAEVRAVAGYVLAVEHSRRSG
jgi:mono/diheme cytochrome c family protein